MDNATLRPEKQSQVESSLLTLESAIRKLESFADRVENNNGKIEMGKSPEDAKPPRKPLAMFLNNLPEQIEMNSKKIEEAINRLQNLLY